MITEIPEFNLGTYQKPCELFSNIMIGSVLCVGYSKIKIESCKYCVSYKEENSYYLPILKENTPIVSEVVCSRPKKIQLTLF